METKKKDIVIRIANAIESGKFNWSRYCSRKPYYGYEIMTQGLNASYGQIGFSVFIYKDGSHIHTIEYDWELERFSVDEDTINNYKRSLIEKQFANELAALLNRYQGEMTVVETKIFGKSIYELSVVNPDKYKDDDDVLLFDKDVDKYIC